MASIKAYDSNSISVLFSSLNSNRSGNSGVSMNFGINLSDYSLIKRGSYYKMLKAYYSIDGTGSDSMSWAKAKTTTSTAADSTKTLASIENAATDLKASAETLYKSGSSSPFKKDANGAYDTDAIYKAVNSFVSDYNTMVSAADKSETARITKTAASMVNVTKVNAKALSAVGITINSADNTLKIDEEAFKKADMSKVKSLFSGNGSYAYSTAVNASMINSYAQTESAKSNTYNGTGNYTYNYNTGELYNSIF